MMGRRSNSWLDIRWRWQLSGLIESQLLYHRYTAMKMTMTMMVMMMMVNICLRTCKIPDIKEIDQQLQKGANPEKSRKI